MQENSQQSTQKRCFIFAIGGTGSRTLRSLIHLLAAGIKPDNNFEIIPIIIDPHQRKNDDLSRTTKLLTSYKNVRHYSNPNGFFSIKLSSLEDLKAGPSVFSDKTSFAFNLNCSGDKSKFKDYIGHSNMNPENKALAELLFSGTSIDEKGQECDLLDIKMDIGFVGNPNVGSVVLNQIVHSNEFTEFANSFQKDDRIFIISSIFGGTGAAGFPCLLKNIREGGPKGSLTNLKEAKVGAVSVLPYFQLEQNEKSAISYSDFIAKTKSALYYYDKTITSDKNKSVNVMYYIGDTPRKSYTNDSGYNGQKNDAHFVELASALAIINFLSLPDDNPHLKSETDSSGRGKAVEPVCNEFGLRDGKENEPTPNLCDFEKKGTSKLLPQPLSQFALFARYMKEEYKNNKAWKTEEKKLDDTFIKGTFYDSYLKPFFVDFELWLKELGKNNRGFAPFELDLSCSEDLKSFLKSDLKSFIKGIVPTTSILNRGPTYPNFDEFLNKYAKGKSSLSQEKKLMDIFYNATSDFLDKYYQFGTNFGGK
jgi:hypothetical protein